jgi:hypothetical protein
MGGDIVGITTQYSTSHVFFSWHKKSSCGASVSRAKTAPSFPFDSFRNNHQLSVNINFYASIKVPCHPSDGKEAKKFLGSLNG